MTTQARRKNPRLRGYSYTTPGSYFVTICCIDRRPIFADTNALGSAESCWNQIPDHFKLVDTDEFVVMPNHIHGIVVIRGPEDERARHASPLRENDDPLANEGPPSLADIIGSYKSAVTRRLRANNATLGSVWQRSYYERVVRNDAELNRVREYIRDNPRKWNEDPYFVAITHTSAVWDD